jgi:hypothetical protein
MRQKPGCGCHSVSLCSWPCRAIRSSMSMTWLPAFPCIRSRGDLKKELNSCGVIARCGSARRHHEPRPAAAARSGRRWTCRSPLLQGGCPPGSGTEAGPHAERYEPDRRTARRGRLDWLSLLKRLAPSDGALRAGEVDGRGSTWLSETNLATVERRPVLASIPRPARYGTA